MVDEATPRASWRPLLEGWGSGQTREEVIAKVRAEVWRTSDGRTLRDLDRAWGAEPYTPASLANVRKSRDGERFAKGLQLLASGISVPG